MAFKNFLAIFYSSGASSIQLGVTLVFLSVQIFEAAGCPLEMCSSTASLTWGMLVGMMMMVLLRTVLRSFPKINPKVLEEPTYITAVSQPLW